MAKNFRKCDCEVYFSVYSFTIYYKLCKEKFEGKKNYLCQECIPQIWYNDLQFDGKSDNRNLAICRLTNRVVKQYFY